METKETRELSGRCLCGAVTLKATAAGKTVGACHCGMCRRWAGGPWLAVDCGTEVTIEGDEHVGLFSSSEWAERAFCKQCGTGLFYRIKGNGQHILSAGLFDATDFTFDHQVFIDDKPGFYAFANETKNLTGAEVFAIYAPPAEE